MNTYYVLGTGKIAVNRMDKHECPWGEKNKNKVGKGCKRRGREPGRWQSAWRQGVGGKQAMCKSPEAGAPNNTEAAELGHAE